MRAAAAAARMAADTVMVGSVEGDGRRLDHAEGFPEYSVVVDVVRSVERCGGRVRCGVGNRRLDCTSAARAASTPLPPPPPPPASAPSAALPPLAAGDVPLLRNKAQEGTLISIHPSGGAIRVVSEALCCEDEEEDMSFCFLF